MEKRCCFVGRTLSALNRMELYSHSLVLVNKLLALACRLQWTLGTGDGTHENSISGQNFHGPIAFWVHPRLSAGIDVCLGWCVRASNDVCSLLLSSSKSRYLARTVI